MGRKVRNRIETTSGPPPSTPQAKEDQMISLAINQAEQQLRNGTAPTQVVVHYLKLATAKSELEKQMLEKKTELMTAQTESIKAQKRSDELFEKALEAMRDYSPSKDDI